MFLVTVLAELDLIQNISCHCRMGCCLGRVYQPFLTKKNRKTKMCYQKTEYLNDLNIW